LGVREIVLQLDANETAEFRRKLQALLHTQETDVAQLLAAFFDTDDSNFAQRYGFFYAELAPAIDLYRVRIGDDLTIKTFGRGGYVHSKTLKVYGTYAFKGLEKSPEAGHLNMMDLVSFRELYGFISADRAKELAAMRASAGATDVDRGRAEAELFGTKREAQEITAADASPAVRDRSLGPEAGASAAYDPSELQSGILLNAAVLVRDESKLNDTLDAIDAAGKRAGLPLKAISWQSAAGLLGQFVTLMRTVLYAAVFIIFVVGLVVINNSLVMATLERVREIGTLRAIGAQRQLILAMLVLESLAIGLAAGIAGVLLGAIILSVLGVTGIGARSDILTFVFSGPRLYPRAGSGQFVFALATVSVVSLLSSLYPAWIAMRVTPRESMQSEE
jgi:ABC-type antimicrobial peptide transport system permease subunit